MQIIIIEAKVKIIARVDPSVAGAEREIMESLDVESNTPAGDLLNFQVQEYKVVDNYEHPKST